MESRYAREFAFVLVLLHVALALWVTCGSPQARNSCPRKP